MEMSDQTKSVIDQYGGVDELVDYLRDYIDENAGSGAAKTLGWFIADFLGDPQGQIFDRSTRNFCSLDSDHLPVIQAVVELFQAGEINERDLIWILEPHVEDWSLDREGTKSA